MRAFDYSESLGEKRNIRNAGHFMKEKSIAWSYVITHLEKIIPAHCAVCRKNAVRFLYQRWDVNYYICDDCNSIFTFVDQGIMDEYLDLEPMRELRTSDEYQTDAENRRSEIWDDLVRWIKFRTFRYTNKKDDFVVIDYADRYRGQINKIRKSGLCRDFYLQDSILEESSGDSSGIRADILLYLNQLQHEINPLDTLYRLKEKIKPEGLLFLSTRLGSGFDILTLKGGLDNIYPYEHVMLPSKKGLEFLLEKAGFELLEFLTPGTMDVQYVLENQERIDSENLFVKQLLETDDKFIIMEFQRLLQKAGLSSFAQIVARS